MSKSTDPLASAADRGLESHVDPSNPTGAFLSHRADLSSRHKLVPRDREGPVKPPRGPKKRKTSKKKR